ncbi:Adenylate cyclase [Cystobacter fuscus DSM 2262]|uniref:Adenylate cyclase n=1 Tax=Cystobacter fuscus (strain ATCC 25194 / DSM 2262 / NBRC 100088 / M29) TaxID=1242864 RepID=S9P5S1_CYSF2|nr:adenylate/guanylate cyclase domain-containing protein [Cystobacter fuscus]EPX58536.1 Adenylate cyclase [Cystobacter fuscus DSM 2262]
MQLIVNPGLLDERVVDLPEGTTTIGRTQESSLCVLHMSLSRRHALLVREAERVLLTDLDSKNGTLVDEVRLEKFTPRELKAGESFRCGEVRFTLVSPVASEPLAPTQVQPLNTRFSPAAMDELLERVPESSSGSALRVKRASHENRANEKLQVLLKVSQLLSSPGQIETLLERILDLVFQIMEVDRVAILLVDPSTGALRPRVARVSTGEAPEGAFYSQRIVDYVRTHSVAALFSDAWMDPRLNDAASVVLQSIRASMCAPLKPRDEVLGVLYVDNLSRADGFSQEDLEFLTAFANQAAIALDNSLLAQKLAEEAVMRNAYARFFPPATLKKLSMARGGPLETIETEVTVLFSDISGFTKLSSELEPRQVVDLLNDYFPVMAEIVFRHEGTLEKYIGDALMAVWGAPFAHPDDATRAVRAAVEMQRALAGLNARWRERGWPELSIHVGLNTGRVAAGNIGSEQYLQYATIGDATNVASRVCSVAVEGQVVMSQATFERWLERDWNVTPLPPTPVKGKQEPLTLYRVEWNVPPPEWS